MHFCKMHGIGNDFIMIDGYDLKEVPDWAKISKKYCDRHFGIGADGLILILPSEKADTRMVVCNSDGSLAQMCGNGLRCAAVFARDTGRVTKDDMTVETGAGILRASLSGSTVTCDMGIPELRPERIPVAGASNRFFAALGGKEREFFCVSMGNPHGVTFDVYPEGNEFYDWGARMEHDPRFPEKANIEFCRVRDGGIDVRVWERGDGETLACGTGASAVLVAAASQGLIGREADIRLPGGTLRIRWAENGHVFMTGPAEKVFEGEFQL